MEEPKRKERREHKDGWEKGRGEETSMVKRRERGKEEKKDNKMKRGEKRRKKGEVRRGQVS